MKKVSVSWLVQIMNLKLPSSGDWKIENANQPFQYPSWVVTLDQKKKFGTFIDCLFRKVLAYKLSMTPRDRSTEEVIEAAGTDTHTKKCMMVCYYHYQNTDYKRCVLPIWLMSQAGMLCHQGDYEIDYQCGGIDESIISSLERGADKLLSVIDPGSLQINPSFRYYIYSSCMVTVSICGDPDLATSDEIIEIKTWSSSPVEGEHGDCTVKQLLLYSMISTRRIGTVRVYNPKMGKLYTLDISKASMADLAAHVERLTK